MSTFGGSEEMLNIEGLSDSEKLTFDCKEFRVIRILLRLLSLWRPLNANILERYFYTAWVNIVLLVPGPVRNIIRARDDSTWLSLQYVYLVHEIGIWLGHILGNIYLHKRDLETYVLPRDEQLTGSITPLRRKVKYLKISVVVSFMSFSIMLCSLYVGSLLSWNQGSKRFSSSIPGVHGALDHVFYVIVIFSILYDLGIGLALAWTMGLLYVCFASRLKALERAYLDWNKPAVDAIYFFRREYSRVVERSWKRISWWFLVHNLVVIAVPLYGYELAQATGGTSYHSKRLPNFLCYLVFVLTVWLAPILIAEQIKRREEKFQQRINEFCPGLHDEISEHDRHRQEAVGGVDTNARDSPPPVPRASSTDENSPGTINHHSYTLVSRRGEFKDFLQFLRHRKLGLVSHGYTWQLNISRISIILGMISFLLNLHREDSVGSLYMSEIQNSTLLY